MAKKNKSRDNDQPELPLDATPAAAAGAGTAPAAPVVNRDSETARPAAPADVPPKRKKGEKVQDEQAPLAQHYRNWFLDYASYVILDRAVPHLDDGLKPVHHRPGLSRRRLIPHGE